MIRVGEYKLNPAHVIGITSHGNVVRIFMSAAVLTDGRTYGTITADNADGARTIVEMVEAAVDAYNNR